jgi:outer membrane biosynthesis protein TonB
MSKIFSAVALHYFAIAVAGAIFAATGAQASPSRSLSLASADATPQAAQPVAAQPTPTTTPSTEAPKQAPQTTTADPSKPKARHASTEARIIHELHRHGIYW